MVWWRSIRDSAVGDDGRDGVGDSHSLESGRVVTRMAASAVWHFAWVEASGFGRLSTAIFGRASPRV